MKKILVIVLGFFLLMSIFVGIVSASEFKKPNHFKLMNPLKNNDFLISQKYGSIENAVSGRTIFHKGIDIAALKGTPIYASESGTVITSRKASGYGFIIAIMHDNGYVTIYSHMVPNTLFVKKGEHVSKGQMISKVGDSGVANGSHLHFEVKKITEQLTFVNIDPERVIDFSR